MRNTIGVRSAYEAALHSRADVVSARCRWAAARGADRTGRIEGEAWAALDVARVRFADRCVTLFYQLEGACESGRVFPFDGLVGEGCGVVVDTAAAGEGDGL